MADPNNWFDGQVEAVNAWAEATVPDEGGGGDPGGGDGEVHAVALLPVPVDGEPGTAITVRVFVADEIGDPLSGESVTLILAGVDIETPAAADTDVAGYAEFVITPESLGELSVQAQAGGITTAAQIVTVRAPGSGYGRGGRGGKRKAAAPSVSYHDIGALPASPTPTFSPPAMQPGMQQRAPGMDKLGQAMAQLAADQEQKLAAQAAQLQNRLSD